MTELWETLNRNASGLEIQWSAAFFIILALAAWRLIKFALLLSQLRRRDGQYVQERRMALLRTIRYAERSYIALIFVFVGVLAMLTPEPVRRANQEVSAAAGWLFLSCAFAMLIGSILEEWLEWHFPSR